jgi:Ca-activated chloride channel homolog
MRFLTLFFKFLLMGGAVFFLFVVLHEHQRFVKGRQFYEQGRYDEAEALYRDSITRRFGSEFADFNEATVLYQKGDYEKAVAFFGRSLITHDPVFRSHVNYNIGNSKFRQAQQNESSDPEKAVSLYRESLQYYENAMEPGEYIEDVRVNHRIAGKKLRVILASLKQRESGRPNAVDQQNESLTGRQKGSAGHESSENKKIGEKNSREILQREDSRGKKEAGGKRSGRNEIMKGEMSRQEAELLLDRFSEGERFMGMLHDRGKGVYYPEVAKDW